MASPGRDTALPRLGADEITAPLPDIRVTTLSLDEHSIARCSPIKIDGLIDR